MHQLTECQAVLSYLGSFLLLVLPIFFLYHLYWLFHSHWCLLISHCSSLDHLVDVELSFSCILVVVKRSCLTFLVAVKDLNLYLHFRWYDDASLWMRFYCVVYLFDNAPCDIFLSYIADWKILSFFYSLLIFYQCLP